MRSKKILAGAVLSLLITSSFNIAKAEDQEVDPIGEKEFCTLLAIQDFEKNHNKSSICSKEVKEVLSLRKESIEVKQGLIHDRMQGPSVHELLITAENNEKQCRVKFIEDCTDFSNKVNL
jgi:hypothetical protein